MKKASIKLLLSVALPFMALMLNQAEIAQATPVPLLDQSTLSLAVGRTYQQTDDNPCLIYKEKSNCAPYWEPSFETKGTYDITTPTGINTAGDSIISVGEFRAALGVDPGSQADFLLGLDLNQTSASQTGLELDVFIGNNYYYSWQQDSISTPYNGEGWADYVGSWGYNSETGAFTPIQIASSVADSEIIQFHLALNGNDGHERLFLINTDSPTIPTVPEPTSLLLLGSGLMATALIFRSKKNR